MSDCYSLTSVSTFSLVLCSVLILEHSDIQNNSMSFFWRGGLNEFLKYVSWNLIVFSIYPFIALFYQAYSIVKYNPLKLSLHKTFVKLLKHVPGCHVHKLTIDCSTVKQLVPRLPGMISQNSGLVELLVATYLEILTGFPSFFLKKESM